MSNLFVLCVHFSQTKFEGKFRSCESSCQCLLQLLRKFWHIDSSFWCTSVDCLHTSVKELMICGTICVSSVHLKTISQSKLNDSKYKVDPISNSILTCFIFKHFVFLFLGFSFLSVILLQAKISFVQVYNILFV